MKAINTISDFNSVVPRYPELKNQVAIITGSSRGIGQGIAIRLAREGMKVVINSRSVEATQAVVSDLCRVGANAIGVPGDISKSEDIHRLIDETMKAFGTIDLLVNNAADLRRYKFFKVTEEILDTQLATNIRGPYLCTYLAAEIMAKKRSGNIIHISSVGGLRAHWDGLPYDVTKGALDAMTRAVALELSEFGIRVNCVSPGATIEVKNPSENAYAQAVIKRIPLKRFGIPLDIGAACAFLASPDADYITGQVIYVDGGITTQLYPPGQPI